MNSRERRKLAAIKHNQAIADRKERIKLLARLPRRISIDCRANLDQVREMVEIFEAKKELG